MKGKYTMVVLLAMLIVKVDASEIRPTIIVGVPYNVSTAEQIYISQQLTDLSNKDKQNKLDIEVIPVTPDVLAKALNDALIDILIMSPYDFDPQQYSMLSPLFVGEIIIKHGGVQHPFTPVVLTDKWQQFNGLKNVGDVAIPCELAIACALIQEKFKGRDIVTIDAGTDYIDTIKNQGLPYIITSRWNYEKFALPRYETVAAAQNDDLVIQDIKDLNIKIPSGHLLFLNHRISREKQKLVDKLLEKMKGQYKDEEETASINLIYSRDGNYYLNRLNKLTAENRETGRINVKVVSVIIMLGLYAIFVGFMAYYKHKKGRQHRRA